jgi:hypothetical protein
VTSLPLVATTFAGLAICLLACGCDRVDSFDLEAGESYCGQITLGHAYRAGFSPRVQVRLSFDSEKVELDESPGTISTFDAGAEEAKQRLLDTAALRPIPPLSHDPLSQLEIGDGRDRNLIYAVSPQTTIAESLLVILSLRSDDAVEVRLIRPGSAPNEAGETPTGREPLFGLFVLERQQGDCGF